MLVEHRYKHAPVSTLIAKWGNPDQIKVLDSGGNLLTWKVISVIEVPVGTPGAYVGPTDTGHATAQVDCAFTVRTDKSFSVVETVQLDKNWNRDACKVWLDRDQSKPRRLTDLGPEFPPPPPSLGRVTSPSAKLNSPR
jgi:hypothetical protein